MANIDKNRKLWKELLAKPEIVGAPGCGDVVTARLVELSKFSAIHASGSVAHRTSGYADAGILTMSEMVERIAAMADRVDLPIIADADSGFGESKDGTKKKYYYVKESVGIACGFLITALHQSGLATLTHTPSPMNFLNTILNRPSSEKPFLLLVVGYPKENAVIPKITKKPLEEIADFI